MIPDYYRVYPNGDVRIHTKEDHEESLRWRPGVALYVKGECVQEGYLGENADIFENYDPANPRKSSIK